MAYAQETLTHVKGRAALRKPCWAEFCTDALRHNVMVARALAPHSRLLAMVKANAYGHGAYWVCRQIGEFVDAVGVARIDEALGLRRMGVDLPIVLFGCSLCPELLAVCAHYRLQLVVHDLESVAAIEAVRLPHPLVFWAKLNVGMNRLGMSAEEFVEAHQRLLASGNTQALIHMSHFSAADEAEPIETRRQMARLRSISETLGVYPLSMANSAGIIAHPDSHADWVRPGILLYGDDPCQKLEGMQALRPVMTFKSRIIALRRVRAGERVGYNGRYQARADCLIATVAAGYADGYPRQAPDGTPVLVRGWRAPLAGRVSMDLLTVDVSGVDGVAVGDQVTLWGEGLPAGEVAERCQTISYELFTRISSRVERVTFCDVRAGA